MANFVGKPLEISRFLGLCDIDDPSNVPQGLAWVCRNTDFGLTSCMTRAGVNLTANGIAAGIRGRNKSPITGLIGLIYTPENADQQFFQLPLLFDMAGLLQGELAVGLGQTEALTSDLFLPPARSHMIATQAYNKAWMAFSDLTYPKTNPQSPTPGMAVLNLGALKYGDPATSLDPFGMKPFGWNWTPKTLVLIGEIAAPSSSKQNGHTYECIQSGKTAPTTADEPAWPTGTGVTVNDGSAIWQERTPTFSQAYPTYPPPIAYSVTSNDGGNWPIAADGYAALPCFLATYVTVDGETDLENARAVVDIPNGNDYGAGRHNGYQSYTIDMVAPPSAPPGLSGVVPTGWNLYVGIVSSGKAGITQAPDIGFYQKWNASPLPFGTPVVVREQVSNGGASTLNSANIVGSGQLRSFSPITGFEWQDFNNNSLYEYGIYYATVLFVNRNLSVSGFTRAAVFPVLLGTNGAMLLADNLPKGPPNTIARIVAITPYQLDPYSIDLPLRFDVASDGVSQVAGRQSKGTSAGPFFYIGNFATGPNYFVFPQTLISDGYPESSTVLGDRATQRAWFSFTQPYLIASSSVTDRLRVIWPYAGVDIFYSATTDRMFVTGAPGFNGHWASLAADPESFYSDSGFIPTQNADGERALCVREFRGQLYSLRERSGYVMQIVSVDDNGNPSWAVRKRWNNVGPCGPRAVDTCGRFMIFVHRSGVYKYDGNPNAEGGAPEPLKVSKEIKYWWKTINWGAKETIWVSIDEETHTVRIGVPTGASQVPNQVLKLFYEEGWNLPIHFSTFTQKEISMDSARRYSVDDVSAFLGLRLERKIPVDDPSIFALGDDGVDWLSSDFYDSQFLYASSGPDGCVLAITPGIWHDGEGVGDTLMGIDWRYETTSQGVMLMQSKFEGFSLNARGEGKLLWAILKGRTMLEDWTATGDPNATSEQLLTGEPIDLSPDQHVGDTRITQSDFGERWRAHFSNGKVPDVWAELKDLVLYAIPFSTGRPESQQK